MFNNNAGMEVGKDNQLHLIDKEAEAQRDEGSGGSIQVSDF